MTTHLKVIGTCYCGKAQKRPGWTHKERQCFGSKLDPRNCFDCGHSAHGDAFCEDSDREGDREIWCACGRAEEVKKVIYGDHWPSNMTVDVAKGFVFDPRNRTFGIAEYRIMAWLISAWETLHGEQQSDLKDMRDFQYKFIRADSYARGALITAEAIAGSNNPDRTIGHDSEISRVVRELRKAIGHCERCGAATGRDEICKKCPGCPATCRTCGARCHTRKPHGAGPHRTVHTDECTHGGFEIR